MIRSAVLLALLLASTSVTAADLKVKISDVRVHTGTLSALLVNSDAAWNGKAEPVTGRIAKADTSGEVSLVFKDLAAGKYAIRVMHDENDNGKLDTNAVGMPTEGYGFSNNPVVMRPATFEEATFEVTEAGNTINIVLR